MNVKKLTLQNYKKFEDTSLEFKPSFNAIVGDSGSGKTSILEGLDKVTGGLIDDLLRGDIIERGYRLMLEGDPSIKSRDKRISKDASFNELAIRCEFETDERISINDEFTLPILSYFSSERVWKLTEEDMNSINSSYGKRGRGYLKSLKPIEYYTPFVEYILGATLDEDELHGINLALDGCLQDYRALLCSSDKIFLVNRSDNALHQYSLIGKGTKSLICLIIDIAYRCAVLNPHLGLETNNSPGIVLIDELELHLHPKQQYRIVEDLRRVFPNIQFIITTNSPFIIQSLREGDYFINLDEPEIKYEYSNQSIEDITECIMGLPQPQHSQRYKDMVAVAEEYYALLDKANLDDEEELEKVKLRLDLLMAPYGDNAAYQAFLKIERLASGIDK